MATHHSLQASENSRKHFDSHINPIKFTIVQLVLLIEQNLLAKKIES
jgi:hypothetical protein